MSLSEYENFIPQDGNLVLEYENFVPDDENLVLIVIVFLGPGKVPKFYPMSWEIRNGADPEVWQD